jgi:hypothetical protein
MKLPGTPETVARGIADAVERDVRAVTIPRRLGMAVTLRNPPAPCRTWR